MNFNQLEQSRLVAEDHMKQTRREADKNRLLASTNSPMAENQPAKTGQSSLRRLFSMFRFGRRSSGRAQPL
jgi:hypothetical protein